MWGTLKIEFFTSQGYVTFQGAPPSYLLSPVTYSGTTNSFSLAAGGVINFTPTSYTSATVDGLGVGGTWGLGLSPDGKYEFAGNVVECPSDTATFVPQAVTSGSTITRTAQPLSIISTITRTGYITGCGFKSIFGYMPASFAAIETNE
jgi:hypothetical protein